MEKLDRILKALTDIVGENYASDKDFILHVYSDDMTAEPASSPEFVVMPDNIEQIQKIVKLANREKIPITPYVTGNNIGGLAIPLEGGIVVDLKRMDRIVEINGDCNYAVVEPAVSFGALKVALQQRGLRCSVPYAPPSASVLCNYLLQGLGSLCMKYGNHADMITGLEVVLPTAELVKVGSCAISPYWFSGHPLPFLIGLFAGWQGTTGIVTKLGLKVYPIPKIRDVYSLLFDEPEALVYMVYELIKTDAVENLVGGTWALTLSREHKAPLTRPSDLSDAYLAVILGAETENEMNAKRDIVEKVVKEAKQKGYGVDIGVIPEKEKEARLELPTVYIFKYLDHRAGGGLSWVGSCLPLHRWPSTYRRVYKLMVDYGFSPIIFLATMDYTRFGLFRPIIPFNKGDKKEVEEVRELLKKIAKVIYEEGGVTYKSTNWMAQMLRERGDPGFFKLIEKVKNTLDPNRIMNPGRWNM